jgi:uncharacterized protein (TIGR03437 family)
MKHIFYALPIAMTLSCAYAQSNATMVGASYSSPASFEVAPGQVITLFFKGVKPGPDGRLRTAQADTANLPVTLAGLSARVTQSSEALNMRIPVFAIRQENQCGSQTVHPACLLTAMKVQMPFELSLNAAAQLILEEDGQPSPPFPLQPVVVNAHVLTGCDLDWDIHPANSCDRLVFHADGRAVNASAPAQAGEVIVLYAFGLGPVWPSADTGRPAAAGIGIPQSGVLRVWATLRTEPLNASASAPRYFDSEASSRPEDAVQFAGLAPGQVGLYQLNVLVPASLEPVLPCGGDIRANALVLVTTPQGSEVVPLCVER